MIVFVDSTIDTGELSEVCPSCSYPVDVGAVAGQVGLGFDGNAVGSDVYGGSQKWAESGLGVGAEGAFNIA